VNYANADLISCLKISIRGCSILKKCLLKTVMINKTKFLLCPSLFSNLKKRQAETESFNQTKNPELVADTLLVDDNDGVGFGDTLYIGGIFARPPR